MTRVQVHALLFTATFSLLALSSRSVSARPPTTDDLTPLQVAQGCALPPVTSLGRPGGLHIIGAQDTVARTLFGERDLLVVDGGVGHGVQIGQVYFVRRSVSSSVYSGKAKAVVTAGWVRVVAANQGTAIAAVERVCTQIEAGDYLEAFVPPIVPAASIKLDRSGDPDFASPGRVLFGADERASGAAGEYMVIDRGAQQGLEPGARFAIYRNVESWMRDSAGVPAAQLPLASIGEGVVVTTGQTMSVMRIMTARDAVQRGDYVVPRPSAR
jgi:hypothetical protein